MVREQLPSFGVGKQRMWHGGQESTLWPRSESRPGLTEFESRFSLCWNWKDREAEPDGVRQWRVRKEEHSELVWSVPDTQLGTPCMWFLYPTTALWKGYLDSHLSNEKDMLAQPTQLRKEHWSEVSPAWALGSPLSTKPRTGRRHLQRCRLECWLGGLCVLWWWLEEPAASTHILTTPDMGLC